MSVFPSLVGFLRLFVAAMVGAKKERRAGGRESRRERYLITHNRALRITRLGNLTIYLYCFVRFNSVSFHFKNVSL